MNELSRGQRIASRESERYEARDDELTAVSRVRVLFVNIKKSTCESRCFCRSE